MTGRTQKMSKRLSAIAEAEKALSAPHQEPLRAIYADLITPLLDERGFDRTYPSNAGGFYRSDEAKPFALSAIPESELSEVLGAKGYGAEHAWLHAGFHPLRGGPADLLIEVFPARSVNRDRVRLSAIADGEVRDIGSVAFTFRDTDLGVEVDATVSVPGVSGDAGAEVAEVVRLLTEIKDARPSPAEDRPDW